MTSLSRTFLFTTGLLLMTSLYALAADCPHIPWQILPNYVPGHGTPCELVGLDTHRGICEPGRQFETRCDDASGGRYKICQGPRRCIPERPVPEPDCTKWDYRHNQPCRWGLINSDCRGDCETRVGNPYPPDCTKWDYRHNQPCRWGLINSDCRGDCETRVGDPYPPDCTKWNFKKNKPCAPGRINTDCRGNCETRVGINPIPRDCQSWDYDKNRPCPPGYINRDCHGGCGRILR